MPETATPTAPPKAPERPAGKDLRELGRQFKHGIRWERTGSDHYRIRDTHTGRLVEYQGRPIETSQNPGSASIRALKSTLTELQLLKGTGNRPMPVKTEKARKEAQQAAIAARTARRQEEIKPLRDSLRDVADLLGGMENRGVAADIAAAARQLGDVERRFTPDLLTGSLYRIANGGWVETRYQEVWKGLVEHLAESDDRVEELFKLIRRGRGLPEEVVSIASLPRVSEDGEWPFTVHLIPLEQLLVDHSYQRPVDWAWVRKTASIFDETLVGTIDVAERAHGASYAIMDGQSRFEALRLVGKKSCWASVYQGLDQEAEARFFLHKNQDRKAVHPYHIWKAKKIANDPQTLKIDAIVEECGYVMSVVSASKLDNKISAIQAVEECFKRTSPTRDECLTPTLKLLHETTFGRTQGQASMLLKGTGRFFQLYDDDQIDYDRLKEVYETRGAVWLLGRSREEASSQGAQLRAFIFVLIGELNRGRTSKRLVMPSHGKRVS